MGASAGSAWFRTVLLLAIAAAVAFATALMTLRVVAAPPGLPQGTGFTFQGSLQENGVPVTGIRTFNLQLFDLDVGGSQVGSTITTDAQVTNGFYTLFPDFGAGAWTTGERRFLQVTVNGSPLTPRTPLLPVPQAVYAAQAGSATTADSATTASQLGGVAAANFARLYGDGSAGSDTLTGVVNLGTRANLSFQDLTINPGAVVTIPSGTVIRCTGTFTNNGIIVVSTGSRSGTAALPGPVLTPTAGANALRSAASLPVHPGHALSAAVPGVMTGEGDTADITGGAGGVGIGSDAARQLVNPGGTGGGAGAGAASQNLSGTGGAGGGSLTVRCAGPVVTSGNITANGGTGTSGGGGGAGGIIILASATSVTNAGNIAAVGAQGGGIATFGTSGRIAQGGAGGGGIIHFIAPSITQGIASVDGGSGALSQALGGTQRTSGGGGGAMCGNGGKGADVAAGVSNGATAGAIGCVIQSLVSPSAIW